MSLVENLRARHWRTSPVGAADDFLACDVAVRVSLEHVANVVCRLEGFAF